VQELADLEWIGWSPGQICHDWLIRTLRKHDIEPHIAHTASEHSTQLALVAAGLGAAIIPRLGREPIQAGVRIIPIEGDPARRVFAVWRTSTSARPATRAAVSALTTAGLRQA
jgi:DNA-binding transcriptional LysR family regulator